MEKKLKLIIPWSNSPGVRKMLLCMKLTLVISLVAVFQTWAAVSYSQTTTLSLNLKNATVQTVLQQVEDQSEFYFLYSRSLIDVDRTIDVQLKDAKITEVLNNLFSGTDVAYKVDGRQIVLSRKSESSTSDMQQQKSVSGKVTDSSGEPLPGVSVVVKGTTTGIITDMDGKYTIQKIPENATLQFSFVGMKSQELAVGNQTTINVVLADETIGLEEVVAVGYGTVKKSDLTGSVTSIKRDDLNQGAISSVDQAMQGRIAGVQISQATNEPGGGLSIRVRGASSINASNEPLYVIDGLPIDNSSSMSSSSTSGAVANVSQNLNTRNPLNSLNPNDIASIEVLKDASATAIYGSRGANGVVLITTKKGKSGKVSLNYDGYGGVQSVAKKIDVLTAPEYMDALNAISVEQGGKVLFTADDITKVGKGTDWQDQIYRVATQQTHNISMAGGLEKTKYFLSVNYFDQQGVVDNTGVKRYIARINIEQEISDRLKLGLNINTSRENSDNYIGGVNTNEQAGAVNAALSYDPTLPVYNANGEFNVSSELTINNPMSVIEGIKSQSELDRVFGNMTFDYKFSKELSAKLNVGVDNQNGRRDLYNGRKTIHGKSNGGQANISSMSLSNILVEYTMNYTKQLNNKSSVDILGGATYQNFINKGFSSGTNNFPSDDLFTNNLGLGDPKSATVSSYKSEYTLASYLGRVNYTFHNFLFTSSIRADGSSRFGANTKWGYFPSFAFGWKLSEESFIPETFSELKLRTSWGQTGNQEIPNYQSLSTFSASGTALLGGIAYIGTSPSRIANPDLKWETTEQLNLGVDVGIFGGKISGSLDYFQKKTKDMLLNLPLPQSTGFSSIMTNSGEMKNSGVEFMITSKNINKNNFDWSTTFNITALKNEVTYIGGLQSIQTGNVQSVGNTTIIKPGLPVSTYYGYRITGIFQDANQVANSAQTSAKPGYPIFENVNGDKTISTADMVLLGDPAPDFTFGLRNNITYKNFNLDFFFQGQYGADLLNVNAIESMYPANFSVIGLRLKLKIAGLQPIPMPNGHQA